MKRTTTQKHLTRGTFDWSPPVGLRFSNPTVTTCFAARSAHTHPKSLVCLLIFIWFWVPEKKSWSIKHPLRLPTAIRLQAIASLAIEPQRNFMDNLTPDAAAASEREQNWPKTQQVETGVETVKEEAAKLARGASEQA